MKSDTSKMPTLVAMTLLAGAYLGWQLIGLRFTNHDDINFHLQSWTFADDYLNFAKNTAYRQARLQAFINMPIILWANSFAKSALYDWINIGSFGALYIAMAWFLGKLAKPADALALTMATTLLFPLHYYFTFPQSYPVMQSWGPAFAFLSGGLLASYLRNPRPLALYLSVILFTSSLWGPEYNFLLHPALLCAAFVVARPPTIGLQRAPGILWPYAFGWGVSAVAYLIFSISSRADGGDAIGRVSLSFDAIAWIKTFIALQEKAFLPLSLWKGIILTNTMTDGGPHLPAVISYTSLWQGSYDRLSILTVFLIAAALFTMLLFFHKPSQNSSRILSFVFLMIAVIPNIVIASSAHYQLIVLKGYLQGHLSTFFSQLGLSGLLFLAFSSFVNRSSGISTRIFSLALSAICLACIFTTTFVYNNINRQAMMANAQKWNALEQLASYLRSDRPDLKKRAFYAPDLWSTIGVSAIPSDNPQTGENYWTAYSRNVLKEEIALLQASAALPDDAIFVRYFPTPAGFPIITVSEKSLRDNTWRIVAISTQPTHGRFFERQSDREVQSGQWSCVNQCILTMGEGISVAPSDVVFRPEDNGRKRLIAQFFIPREVGYTQPY